MGAGRVVQTKDGLVIYDAGGNARVKIGVFDEMSFPTRLFVEGETKYWEATTTDNWDKVLELLVEYPLKRIFMYQPNSDYPCWRVPKAQHWRYTSESEIPKEILLINMLLGD